MSDDVQVHSDKARNSQEGTEGEWWVVSNPETDRTWSIRYVDGCERQVEHQNSDGTLDTCEYDAYGTPNGRNQLWYLDIGVRAKVSDVVDGVENGPLCAWSRTGLISYFGMMRDGKPQGYFFQRNDDYISLGWLEAGKRNGLFFEIHETYDPRVRIRQYDLEEACGLTMWTDCTVVDRAYWIDSEGTIPDKQPQKIGQHAAETSADDAITLATFSVSTSGEITVECLGEQLRISDSIVQGQRSTGERWYLEMNTAGIVDLHVQDPNSSIDFQCQFQDEGHQGDSLRWELPDDSRTYNPNDR